MIAIMTNMKLMTSLARPCIKPRTTNVIRIKRVSQSDQANMLIALQTLSKKLRMSSLIDRIDFTIVYDALSFSPTTNTI